MNSVQIDSYWEFLAVYQQLKVQHEQILFMLTNCNKSHSPALKTNMELHLLSLSTSMWHNKAPL